MKRHLLTLAFLSSSFALWSQDLIVLRSDEEIISEVVSIDKWYITYRLAAEDSSVGEVKIPKVDISYIVFQDGMKQFFSANDAPPLIVLESGEVVPDSVYDGDAYQKGIEDAKEFYHKKAPFWGTFGATAFYPVAGIFTGIITGVVVGAIPPGIDASEVPNPAMFAANNSYAAGYRDQAHKNKVKEVMKGFGAGAVLQTVFIIILVATF